MEHKKLTPDNIYNYLDTRKETKRTYEIFHIDYTDKEKEVIKKFNLTLPDDKTYISYAHCGNNIPNIKEFFKSFGNNSDEDIDTVIKIINRLIDHVILGYKKEHYWINIRIANSNHDWDIPRWHTDGLYIPNGNLASKFVTVIKGPGTLLKEDTIESKDIFNSIKKEFEEDKSIKNYQEKEKNWRPKYDEKLKDIKTLQLENDDGLIFVTDNINNDIGAIHSEPKMDKSRMFISIVPGTKEDIDTLIKQKYGQCVSRQNGGYYNKLNKYRNKLFYNFN